MLLNEVKYEEQTKTDTLQTLQFTNKKKNAEVIRSNDLQYIRKLQEL